jgi:tRNA threonylcarbamoyladenosine biosynthesis protein TsaB
MSEVKILILETSERVGQVAVALNDRLLALRRLEQARRHNRDLAPAVRDLCAEQGWRARDLGAVLVSRGPGSYTGLRVGVMSAKALAYATGCALLAVETFHAVAAQATAAVDRLDVIADAQQGHVYVQHFLRDDRTLRPESPLRIQPLGDWLAQRPADAWVSGPGLAVYSDRLPAGTPVVEKDLWYPSAESLLRLGWERYIRGERDDFWSLEPLYLRPSAAEEKWRERPRET